jgi:hypothetical protein
MTKSPKVTYLGTAKILKKILHINDLYQRKLLECLPGPPSSPLPKNGIYLLKTKTDKQSNSAIVKIIIENVRDPA